MPRAKIFVCEFLSVDRLPASAVAVGEVSTLHHEVFDNTVERTANVMQWLATPSHSAFSSAQSSAKAPNRTCKVHTSHTPTHNYKLIPEHCIALSIDYLKFSAVLGTTSLYKRNTMRPAVTNNDEKNIHILIHKYGD